MQTDELERLATDFARRARSVDWLTDALLVAGMYPSTHPLSGPRARTIGTHLILIGPTTDESPPVKPLARSTRGGADWIRVSPYRSGLLDPSKLDDTLATRPLPTNGREFNILVVHYTRRHESGGYVRYNIAHHHDMDQPGAQEKLASDEWVHDTFSPWLDEGPTPA
jgi:hypothetical protein